MNYEYAVCCGKPLHRKARRFTRLYWCRDCKVLHRYKLEDDGLRIRIKYTKGFDTPFIRKTIEEEKALGVTQP